jgi:hypothetical protein
MTASPSTRGALLAKIGAALQAAQVLGFVFAFISMNRRLASVPDAEGPAPGVVHGLVDQHIIYIYSGVGLAALGILMVLTAAIIYRYRAEWLFWFMCLYGGAMCLSYMMPLGLICVIYALKKKKEFPLDPGPQPGTFV